VSTAQDDAVLGTAGGTRPNVAMPEDLSLAGASPTESCSGADASQAENEAPQGPRPYIVPMSRRTIAVLVVVAFLLLLALFDRGSTHAPPTRTTPAPTIAKGAPSSGQGTSTQPAFSTGGGGTSTSSSGSSGPGSLSVKPEGTDRQERSPAIQQAQKQTISSHPIFQRLPISQGGVTLSVGGFGDSQAPGIEVTYTTSLQQAHDIVAALFSQAHDNQASYTIRYSG
jgi:hypothetical protein